VDVLAELLGEDLQSWPEDAWLVFDDYQEIAATQAAERLVEELVAASSVQLLIVGRQRPSWITARRILYGKVLELSQAQLAMDTYEAADVLSERNAASAAGLVALANGWPAVIGLASVSTAEIDDHESVPESLYDFFAEEVFSALARDVQVGLATLAIAPVLDRTLADTLLGGQAERICDGALNVGILVERGVRLEIHPLARAFLAERHEQLGHAGSFEHCLEHYRERADWDAAFDLVARRGPPSHLESLLEEALDELLETARLSTIENWCECLHRFAPTAPALLLARAEVALRRGLLAEAQAHGEAIAAQSSSFRFRGLMIAGRAAHLASLDIEALELFRRAGAGARTRASRREAKWGEALCMMDLELPEATSAVDELASGVGLGDAREAVRAAMYRMICRTRIHILELTDADRVLQLLPGVDDPLVESAFLSVYSAGLGAAARYEDAWNAAAALLAIAQRYRLDFAVPHGLCAAGVAAAGLRKWDEAERILRDGAANAREASDAHGEQACLAALFRTLAQRGRCDVALALADEHSLRPSAPVPVSMRAEFAASRALLLAATDRVDEAIVTVDSVRGISRAIDVLVLTAAVDAIVSLKRRQPDAIGRVNELFENALVTGELDHIVTAYRTVPELLAIVLRSPASGRLGELVRRVGDDDVAQVLGYPVVRQADGAATLTAREREVYALLQQGFTNRAIGKLLFISEGTAKLHVQHIFDKLGVRSRKAIAIKAVLERSTQATSAIDDTGVGTDSSLL
jgi:DNA-binding CsgD family transcriptional regulator/tetratricopeptide (TPR) repeat protein